MSDSITLLVGGQKIEHFESYTVEADLYTADDAFSLELAQPETSITKGQRCELYVNGTLELTGIIDRVSRTSEKGRSTLRVEGRDLMGLLVDSYCEQFMDVQGKTVKQLAEQLLVKVPFIKRSQIVYQENFIGRLKGKKKTVSQPMAGFLDTPQKISRIEPGMTVFEVLKTYAASRGLMFWAMPDGTFVFGRPKAGGAAAYTIVMTRSGQGGNAVRGELVEDISKRYSKVVVLGQGQGYEADGNDAGRVNTKAVKEDKTFPFYKPYVTRLTHDAQSPALHARLLLDKQRHDGFQLTYRVPRHSQNARNWAINELCQVRDEVHGIDGTYLLYGRTFELSKQGCYTTLKLGTPGVVE